MQKQKRQMILILALLVVFGAAYVGMRIYNKNEAEQEEKDAEASKIYVTNENQEDITAFSYQNDSETLSFVKEDDWLLEDEKDLKLDQSAVEAIVEKLSCVEAKEKVEQPEDLSEYGLDSPENVITLTTASGSTTLTLGMQNPVTSEYYLTKSGDDTIYLVDSGFSASFSKTAEELKAAEESTEVSTAKEPQETEE